MIIYFLNIFNILIQTLIFALFYNEILTPKKSYKLTVMIFTVCNFGLYLLTFHIRGLIQIKTPISLAILFVAIYLLYKESLKVKIIKYIISIGVAVVCEILSVFIYLQIDEFDAINDMSIQKLMAVMFFNIIFVSLSMIATMFINHINGKFKWQLIAILLGLPAFQVILMMSIFINNIQTLNKYILLYAVMGMALAVFTDLAIYSLLKNLQNKSEEEKLQGLIGTYQNLDMKYYALVLEESQKSQKLKHDILNYIQTIYALVLSENNSKKQIGIEMLENLKTKISNIPETNFCDNRLINSILTIKCIEAEKSGIQMQIAVAVPDSINIDKVDLCSAFGNLLDNAIEACKKKGANRFIEVRAAIKLDYLITKVTNSTEDTIKIKLGELVTTKKDKINHGLGLKILKDLADKYDGDFDINSKNKQFVAILSLKI